MPLVIFMLLLVQANGASFEKVLYILRTFVVVYIFKVSISFAALRFSSSEKTIAYLSAMFSFSMYTLNNEW